MTAPLRLVGATGSPYTQKMVALLRYRRIPYAVHWGMVEPVCEAMGIAAPKPALMPTFFFDEAGATAAVCDSTPIIRRLERSHAERSVIPPDPALAFVDYLIEDFADEWCTKFMFHFRWQAEADADNAGTKLPLTTDVSLPGEQLAAFKAGFSARQKARLYVVGSNEHTAPVIDASYRRLLAALEAHLAMQPFMLGRRPGGGDFALYGQLSQLVGFDPTPRAIAHALSPRTVAWVDLLADQSGLEPVAEDWLALEQQPASLRQLLGEIGRVYAPALLANAHALAAGKEAWEADIDGARWRQQTFPYQAKCLRWINEQYQSLSQQDRGRVDAWLQGTGVESLLTTD